MPLTLADASSDPIEFTNVGTSATDIDLVLADGSSDPINITGTSNSATVFRDGDTDTYIKVEDTTDDDTIKMATAGTQRLSIDSTGVVDIESAKLEIAGAAGSADQVLTTNGSGTISWATPGTLVKLATATASNSSTLTFDNFVDASEYTSYKIVMEGIYGSEASTLRAYFRTSTPSDITDTYHNSYYERALESGDTDSTGKQDFTHLEIWGGQGATVDHQWNAEATLHAPSNGYGAFHITGTLKNNSDKFMFAERYSMNNTTTGIQGIRFYMLSGNIAAGTVTIYGVKR